MTSEKGLDFPLERLDVPLIVSLDAFGPRSKSVVLAEPRFRRNQPGPRSKSFSSFIGSNNSFLKSYGQSFIAKNTNNYLSFHEISKVVTERKYLLCRQSPKIILQNVSGIFNIGVNAIMGPSGSGKTSLLNVLAGRTSGGVSGYVTFTGEIVPDNFRYISGYVPQDDIVPGVMTVRENIMFSAQLRLSRDIPYHEKVEKVSEVISDMGLEHCSDSKVGGDAQRGISGGERKRTSIAMELIVSPGIIFLDEPTTGLDAATAVTVIETLHKISRHDRVIIMSIHQPRYSIFKLFDNVTLLSRGELVYTGQARGAIPYFNNVLGLECAKHCNPTDFFLDHIIENEQNSDYGTSYALKFKKSGIHERLQQRLQPIINAALLNPVTDCSTYAVNFFWQVFYVSKRITQIIARDRTPLFAAFFITLLSLITGLVFLQLDTDLRGQRNRAGVLFMALANMTVLGVSALDVFLRQKALLIPENLNGFYSVGAYFIAIILTDIIPLRIVPAILYCPAAYFLSDLRSGASRFFFFMLTLSLVNYGATAQTLMFSAFFKAFNVADALYLLTLAVNVLFCGYIVTLGSLGRWIFWVQYLDYLRYGFGAFMWNEFEGTVFCDTLPGNATNVNQTCPQQVSICCDQIPSFCNLSRTSCGDELLDRLELDEFNVWWNILLMFVLGTIFMALSFIGFLTTTRRK